MGESRNTAASSSTNVARKQVALASNSHSITSINDKLIALGLSKQPLELEELSEKQEDNVTRVLSALLQFRTDDLERMEAISTAHRILAHDHERLQGTHKKLKTQVGLIEKEKEAARSQLSDVAGKLKREQEAHRLARDEVNKARTALAFVRTQAQIDNKKRDAQMEKTMQNWQRLASENSRLLAANITTGLVCLNPIRPNEVVPRVDSFWDPNIKALDAIRESLQEECEAFRHVTLSTANQLQECIALREGKEHVPRLTPAVFFNLPSSSTSQAPNQISSSTSHPSAADVKLRELLAKLRAQITAEGQSGVGEGQEMGLDQERMGRVREMLEGRIGELEVELASTKTLVAEGQKLFIQYNEKDDQLDVEVTPPSPGPDISQAEEERLKEQRDMLDRERKELTENAVKLGHERLALEAERAAFAELQRSRQLQSLLSSLPDTPKPIEAAPLFSSVTDDSELASAPAQAAVLPPISAHKPIASPSKVATPRPNRPVVSSPLARSRTPFAAVASARKRVGPGKKIGTPLSRVALTRATIEAISERKKTKAALSSSTSSTRPTGLNASGTLANRPAGPQQADLVRASKAVKTAFGSRLEPTGKKLVVDASAAGGKERLGRSNLGKEWEAKMAANQGGPARVTGVTDQEWRVKRFRASGEGGVPGDE